MKYNCHHFHLELELEVDKMLLLQASIMIMVLVALHGSYDPQMDYYSAGASMYEDRFGCKVCNIGKKHSINVCTHCKIGWKKEPFACSKCQFGSEAGKYNCQHCRRNEGIAFEDTAKCRKDESVGIERSQGGTKEFLYKDGEYEYYKVTVDKGTRMTTGQVAETCKKAGLKAVCPGNSRCPRTDMGSLQKMHLVQ